MRETLALLEATTGLQKFFDLAMERIRIFTGYDRVMAYKFAEDGSGHVVAEAKRAELSPIWDYTILHQIFPLFAPHVRPELAADLPDVDYVPVPLVPECHPSTGSPIDMSYAILRSVR